MSVDFPHANPFAVLDTTPNPPIHKKKTNKQQSIKILPPGMNEATSFAAVGNVARDVVKDTGRRSSRDARTTHTAPRHHHNGRTYDRRSMTNHTDSHKALVQGWGGTDGHRALQDDTQAGQDAQAERHHSIPTLPSPSPTTTTATTGGSSSTMTSAPLESEMVTLQEYRRRSISTATKKLHEEAIRTVAPAPKDAKPVAKATEEQSYFVAPGGMTINHSTNKHRGTKKGSKPMVDTAFSFAHPEQMVRATSV